MGRLAEAAGSGERSRTDQNDVCQVDGKTRDPLKCRASSVRIVGITGNWTAASGIASDELRNVPAEVVIDSFPSQFRFAPHALCEWAVNRGASQPGCL